MRVTIPACEQHEGFFSMTVNISDYCPKCGGKRGVPYKGFSYDGSRRLVVDCWENPCGHVDKYSEVREEVRRRAVLEGGRMTDKKMSKEYVDTLLNKDDSELDKFLDENLGDLKLTKKQAGTEFGYQKAMKEWRNCFMSCSSPYCADKFRDIQCGGMLGNMTKEEKRNEGMA